MTTENEDVSISHQGARQRCQPAVAGGLAERHPQMQDPIDPQHGGGAA